MMLLYCTRKKQKGPHYQLCGGHIDEPEFLEAGKCLGHCHGRSFFTKAYKAIFFLLLQARLSPDPHTQLLIAAQKGAARELFEETGIDMRQQLHRLEPAGLRPQIIKGKDEKPILTCEHKKRLYFFLQVSDDDFWSTKKGDVAFQQGLAPPLSKDGSHLMVSRTLPT
jgi:8-oxo-dGTP pyrophosphatase MutT (NUDIX family)